MITRFLLLLTALPLTLSTLAQKKDGTRYIHQAGTTTYSFEKIHYYKKQAMPFREIIVVDKRFDTSKAGYANVISSKSNYSKIHCKYSWSTILNNYFQSNLDSTAEQKLVIFLRTYWLQRGAIDEIVHKKLVKKPVFGSTDYGGHCIAGLDVYVQTGTSLQALFRIDTTFINMAVNYSRARMEEFFFLPFDSIARRLAATPVTSALSNKRKLSWEEVNDFYDKRFDIPVLKDAVVKKGIFMSFADFKQNKPYATEFRFKNGRLTDELYVVHNGGEEMITDYWGFADSSGVYIHAGFSSFKAVRQHNTFELFGAKHISNYHNRPAQGDISIISYGIDEKILQVNMENGKVH